jgi:ubiquinone/menaquinone biosynthesis C-methylase UbiE
LQRVQAKAQAANLNNIRFLQAGAGEDKLEHSYYDRAVLVTVLGEIPDREAALREIVEALKPGGILPRHASCSLIPSSISVARQGGWYHGYFLARRSSTLR